jgi:predicted permease
MSLFLATFQSVAMLLGIGSLGFALLAKRVVPGQAFQVLTPLALEVALPCKAFHTIITRFSPEKDPHWYLLPLAFLLFWSGSWLFAWGGGFLTRKENRPEFRAGLLYHNSIFFPLAIITGTFGAASHYIQALFLLTLFHPPLVFSSYPFLWKQKGVKRSWSRIFNPMFFATLLAVGLVLMGLEKFVPQALLGSIELVGGMAIPAIMLIIGGDVFTDLARRTPYRFTEVAKFAVLKCVVFPLIMIPLLVWIEMPNELRYLLFLQSVVPPITGIPIFAGRMGGNASLATQLVVGTFLFSLFSIPTMAWVYSVWGGG